ncbi:hypothetical protein E2C01_031733 [Portunus trituberculatus]|uniref:Uncharacterized protein n=1 Tax=Portunus trituberculatus TaxID=210409 RepID=A0A5B7EYX9_PORTR|nr:hypothetical protein [Portunus trituberculatus]
MSVSIIVKEAIIFNTALPQTLPNNIRDTLQCVYPAYVPRDSGSLLSRTFGSAAPVDDKRKAHRKKKEKKKKKKKEQGSLL